MFKIIQISACCSENYFYTVGLGDDGKVYLWDRKAGEWKPHTVLDD